MDPLQFAYQPGIGVDDAIIFLLDRSLSHLGKVWKHCEDHVQHYTACTPGGQAGARGGEPAPYILDPG